MRPDPVEVLEGIAVSLEGTVLAEVEDPVTQGQVAVMAVLLRDLASEWDGEVDRLRTTIATWERRLQDMVGALAEAQEQARVPRRDVDRLVDRIGAVLEDGTDSLSLRALVERRNALAAVLADLLVVCERSSAEGDDAPSALRADAYATVLEA